MKDFCKLVNELFAASENKARQLDLLKKYFASQDPENGAWAVYLLKGQKEQKGNKGSSVLIKMSGLRRLAEKEAGISSWLFDQCQAETNDLAETIALLLPEPEDSQGQELRLSELMSTVYGSYLKKSDKELRAIKKAEVVLDEIGQEDLIAAAWKKLAFDERTLFNKVLTASFKSPVLESDLARALAASPNCKADYFELALKLCENSIPCNFIPCKDNYLKLLEKSGDDCEASFPMSFEVHQELEQGEFDSFIKKLDLKDWTCEWNWAGIRAQLVISKSHKRISIWSCGGELLNSYFPELVAEAEKLACDAVVEGMIIAYKDLDPLPYSSLKRRLAEKRPGERLLKETPVVFMFFDLLKEAGVELSSKPLEERRARLKNLLSGRNRISSQREYEQLMLFSPCVLRLSPLLKISHELDFQHSSDLGHYLSQARKMKVAGIVLKPKESSCKSKEPKNSYVIRLDDLKLDAVLVASQPLSNRKDSGFLHTFALWRNSELLPVARLRSTGADSNLTEAENLLLSKFIDENTLEKFGPVRSLKPELVFELSFRDFELSRRHKAGISLYAARIMRLSSKEAQDANKLSDLFSMV